MIQGWRITKAKHAAGAFDGEGARLNGGRWTSPGTRVVYVSASASLATLEVLAGLGHADRLTSYVLIPCTFDEGLVAKVDRSALPASWRESPAPPELQMIGDAWAREASSAILEVPSAIIEHETNFLLNPLHSDFDRIAIGPRQPYRFDRRLIQR